MSETEGRTPIEGTVDVTPRWFGTPPRPRLGFLHRPAGGQARGAVVICPSFGAELNFSYRLLRVLAERLADRGLLVVRFDYDGTGQSAGQVNDPGRREAYRQSVVDAVSLVREEGAEWVAGVGFRLGSTVLADAAAGPATVDALVLWDPCLSGRSFLREQRALLGTLEIGTSPEEGTEIAGYLLSPTTTAEFATLELPRDLERPPGTTLVLLDAERPGGARVRRQLGDLAAEWHEYELSSPIFDVGEQEYALPEPALERVVEWLDDRSPARRTPLRESSAAEHEAVVARAADGTPIVERLTRIGDGDLFAIETRGTVREDLPTVLFLSMAAEPSIGPGRQWVELARRWAAEGVRSVRLDFSGIGESPPRPGAPEREIYAPTVLADVREAMPAVDRGSGVVLVGVCSGAYAALKVAPVLRPAGIVSINPLLTFRAMEHWWSPDEIAAAATIGGSAARLGLMARPRAWALARVRRLASTASDRTRDAAWRKQLAERLPPVVWSLAFRLGLAHSPAGLIAPGLDAGVPVLLMCGEPEARQPLARTPRVFRRMADDSRSRFALVSGLDHSLRSASSRADAVREMEAFLTQFAGGGASPDTVALAPEEMVAA